MSATQPRREGDDARLRPGSSGAAPDPKGSAHRRSSYGPALSRGYGDAMGRGLELALTLLVMVGVGWLIDRAAGTYPLFIIILSVVGFVGIAVKLWLGYDLEMRKHEDGAIWNRPRTGTGGKQAA